MYKVVTNRLFKTKLAIKIWVTMILATLAVLLFVYVSFNIYFNKFILNNSIETASYDTSYVASNFSKTYNDLIKQFVFRTSSTDFKEKFKLMHSSTYIDYTNVNNSLQTLFAEYRQMNYLTESILFARKGNDKRSDLLFYSYNNRLKRTMTKYNLDFDLSNITGITVLPHSKSPFMNQPEVMPILIPLEYLATNNMVLIADEIENTDMILYFFLSTSNMIEYFRLYCNDKSQGLLYLVNDSGENMSLSSSHPSSAYVNSDEFISALTSAFARDELYFQTNDNYIFYSKLSELDLYLVNIVPREKFTSRSHNIIIFLLWLALASVIMITCLSFMVSKYVTRPLKKLMVSVNEIENNTYKGKIDSISKDEIGQLSDELDSMYKTIQQQIVSIKKEEEKNYKAKLQMLTEQINPHFLYNALEFINMEVYSNHTETASGMITNLGNYLRISLAHGENELLIGQEIEQVKAYVNIMNYRFNHGIKFSTNIPEALLNQKILKSIMQPMVENSLKHGFKIGSSNGYTMIPAIDISMLLDGLYLTLTITDNGAGIDIERATQIMLTKHSQDSTDKHFGLYNIYQRLITFYGDVKIEFFTIPFYENKVIIKLPASFFEI